MRQPALHLPRWPDTFALAEAHARRLGLALALLVVAGGSWLLAGLLWGFTTPLPRPFTAQATSAVDAAERLAERQLFAGQAQQAAVPAMASDNLRLLGVSASGDARTARAIIRRDGQAAPLVLAIGDELGNGSRVLRIEPEQVVLGNPGRESVLALPRPTQTATQLRQPAHD